jgi:hypothetical protein
VVEKTSLLEIGKIGGCGENFEKSAMILALGFKDSSLKKICTVCTDFNNVLI